MRPAPNQRKQKRNESYKATKTRQGRPPTKRLSLLWSQMPRRVAQDSPSIVTDSKAGGAPEAVADLRSSSGVAALPKARTARRTARAARAAQRRGPPRRLPRRQRRQPRRPRRLPRRPCRLPRRPVAARVAAAVAPPVPPAAPPVPPPRRPCRRCRRARRAACANRARLRRPYRRVRRRLPRRPCPRCRRRRPYPRRRPYHRAARAARARRAARAAAARGAARAGRAARATAASLPAGAASPRHCHRVRPARSHPRVRPARSCPRAQPGPLFRHGRPRRRCRRQFHRGRRCRSSPRYPSFRPCPRYPSFHRARVPVVPPRPPSRSRWRPESAASLSAQPTNASSAIGALQRRAQGTTASWLYAWRQFKHRCASPDSESAARRVAANRHLGNLFDEIGIRVPALLGRPRQVLALGEVGIGIRLDDVDGVVVREPDVDAAVVAQARPPGRRAPRPRPAAGARRPTGSWRPCSGCRGSRGSGRSTWP